MKPEHEFWVILLLVFGGFYLGLFSFVGLALATLPALVVAACVAIIAQAWQKKPIPMIKKQTVTKRRTPLLALGVVGILVATGVIGATGLNITTFDVGDTFQAGDPVEGQIRF
jgi:predicted RND superfamily exporter protein